MDEPAVSVVIPTFDRLEILPEVLEGLERQREAPPFEVIVVDDGSTDGSSEWLERYEGPCVLRWYRQSNRGPAAARNRGIEEARGEIVAFLGDDTVPEPGWLACHFSAHGGQERAGRRQEMAVIGYTAWHPRMKRTRFLDYINEYGLQFGYALIEDPDRVPFNFFYTSNLSLPRRLLLEERFDTGFPYAAWEDIELSYRLTKAGMNLHYRPDARVQHDHPTDLDRFCERQERAGYCAVVFYRLHPELGSFLGIGEAGPPPVPPLRRQRWERRLARALQRLPVTLAPLWEDVLRFHYIAGLQRGWVELHSGIGSGASGSLAPASDAPDSKETRHD